jgi:sugar lactone lactonase YvrE
LFGLSKQRTLLALSIAAGAVAVACFLVPGAAVRTVLVAAIKPAPRPTELGWPVRASLVAGDGIAGFLDASGGSARFSDPYGLVIDRAGNLFVADAGENNRIRKIAPNGVVSTIAGGREGFADGAAGDAAFNTPSGLAIDHAGNLFVADTANHAIRRITPQGAVTTLAGTGQAGYRDGAAGQAQFNGPVGVAVDAAGNVYVADTYNDRIRKITIDGEVTTLAGGAEPGFLDGPGATARFDTPCALVVDASGALFIADTRNSAIRKLTEDGQVTTLAVTPEEESATALLRRPVALALTADGVLYVGDMARGRILQITRDGELRGLTGIGIDIEIGDDKSVRFVRPSAIAIDRNGALFVADAVQRVVRYLAPQATSTATPPARNALPAPAAERLVTPARSHAPASAAVSAPVSVPALAAVSPTAPVSAPVRATATATATAPAPARPPLPAVPSAPAGMTVADFPWPLAPQHGWHEVVGTMGEVRGNYDGESRDHFHNGLDVQGAMGDPVLAVAAEKVSSPSPNWSFGGLGEGIGIDSMAYIHMRVGRTFKDAPIDPARFVMLTGANDKPVRVRVRRGTRFAVGDTLGTINRMFHVHLVYAPDGRESNPQALPLTGFADRIAPHIDSIALFDQAGRRLLAKHGKRVLVTRSAGPLAIVVDAYDQNDGNLARRRLGLYKLGYQIVQADGTPVAGFEQPLMNIEFNRLPPDRESVKIAYAGNSGITVHGNAATKFLYEVTNIVRDGAARSGSWQPARLAPGDYVIRIVAADYAGNEARHGRELSITIE